MNKITVKIKIHLIDKQQDTQTLDMRQKVRPSCQKGLGGGLSWDFPPKDLPLLGSWLA